MIDTSRFCVLAKKMFGLSVSPSQEELFDKFAEEVVETNKKFNLTSITDSDAFLENISWTALPPHLLFPKAQSVAMSGRERDSLPCRLR